MPAQGSRFVGLPLNGVYVSQLLKQIKQLKYSENILPSQGYLDNKFWASMLRVKAKGQ